MSRKSETREIDGLEITCTQLGVMEAYDLAFEIAGMLVPLVGLRGDQDVSALAPAFQQSFGRLSKEERRRLCLDLLACTKVKMKDKFVDLNRQDNISLVFDGKAPTLFKTLWFSIEVNFKNFLELLPAEALAGADLKMAQ